jgi:hypothetical protein
MTGFIGTGSHSCIFSVPPCFKNILSTRRHRGHREMYCETQYFLRVSPCMERGYTKATEDAPQSAEKRISVLSVSPCFKKNILLMRISSSDSGLKARHIPARWQRPGYGQAHPALRPERAIYPFSQPRFIQPDGDVRYVALSGRRAGCTSFHIPRRCHWAGICRACSPSLDVCYLPGTSGRLSNVVSNLPGTSGRLSNSVSNLPGTSGRLSNSVSNPLGTSGRPSYNVCYLPGTSGRQSYSVCYLPGSSGRQSYSVCYLPGTSGRQSYSVCYLPGTSGRQSYSVCYLPGTSGRQSYSVCYLPGTSGRPSRNAYNLLEGSEELRNIDWQT